MSAGPRGRGQRSIELERRGIAAAERLGRDDALWPGQLATFAALLLLLAMPRALTVVPGWILPAAEAGLLGALVLASRSGRGMEHRHQFAIALVLVAVIANVVALGLLVDSLVQDLQPGGRDLLLGGILIWCTNLVLFAVVYWELDRGGPVVMPGRPARLPDFLFPQMSDSSYNERDWKPRFGDYLYVSLTNQTAFSPTDTLPLTRRAKALMGLQGFAAFGTAAVIVARAVNSLS